MRKRLLYVATRQFWPATTGHETVLYHYCKGLCEEYKYDIYLFCFADKNADKRRPKPDFIKEVIYVDVPGRILAIGNILTHSLVGTKKWPLQNSLYYSKRISDKLYQYYQMIKPDVLFIDMVRLVPYMERFRNESIKKVLIAEDDLAKRYRRQIESSDVGSAAGYYSSNMSGLMNKMVSRKTIKNFVLKMEIKRLEDYESCFVSVFDYITFISPVESQEYNEKYCTDKAIKLTMGADVEFYSQGETDLRPNHSLAFVGNYTYAPNADSIEMICRDIIPKLGEDICFYVIGKCPEDLKRRIESQQVKVLGFVDDIRPIVKSVDVYLSPITYGTGIKTKVIEAMAMGVPVVTNNVGAESLAVKNGRELFIEDSIEAIVRKVEELFEKPDLREQVGKSGQRFVLENHSWERVYETFGKMGL